MGLLDSFSSSSSASGSTSAKGVNDIPAPRSDSSVNAPPPEQHRRVVDFVRAKEEEDGWNEGAHEEVQDDGEEDEDETRMRRKRKKRFRRIVSIYRGEGKTEGEERTRRRVHREEGRKRPKDDARGSVS
ncbi:hypothetical protein JCM24511_03516 [Saitozyma sp. JCM 24511]|nr:hypothetical protein JCM24511_03516 [Saitozyma sp. JCM 24511]